MRFIFNKNNEKSSGICYSQGKIPFPLALNEFRRPGDTHKLPRETGNVLFNCQHFVLIRSVQHIVQTSQRFVFSFWGSPNQLHIGNLFDQLSDRRTLKQSPRTRSGQGEREYMFNYFPNELGKNTWTSKQNIFYLLRSSRDEFVWVEKIKTLFAQMEWLLFKSCRNVSNDQLWRADIQQRTDSKYKLASYGYCMWFVIVWPLDVSVPWFHVRGISSRIRRPKRIWKSVSSTDVFFMSAYSLSLLFPREILQQDLNELCYGRKFLILLYLPAH